MLSSTLPTACSMQGRSGAQGEQGVSCGVREGGDSDSARYRGYSERPVLFALTKESGKHVAPRLLMPRARGGGAGVTTLYPGRRCTASRPHALHGSNLLHAAHQAQPPRAYSTIGHMK